jgi:hypothetical protein
MRPVPPPYLPIPMAVLGRRPALPQDLLLWGWLRLREGSGPTPLPPKAYIARCLRVHRDTVTGALDRLARTYPPLLVLHGGRGRGGRPRTTYQTADLTGSGADASPPTADGDGDPGSRTIRHEPRRGSPIPATRPGTGCGTRPHPPADAPDASCRTGPHDVIEPQTNPEKEKGNHGPAADLSLYPALFRDGLNDEERRIVRSAFPYGCSPAQLRRLMQAVVAASREGCPASFIAYGVRVLVEDDDAPWDALARQVAFLKEDMRRTAVEFDEPLFRIPDFRDWLDAHRDDAEVRAWIQEVEGRRMRCNCLLVWRHDL